MSQFACTAYPDGLTPQVEIMNGPEDFDIIFMYTQNELLCEIFSYIPNLYYLRALQYSVVGNHPHIMSHQKGRGQFSLHELIGGGGYFGKFFRSVT